jgi:hypothetical protein
MLNRGIIIRKKSINENSLLILIIQLLSILKIDLLVPINVYMIINDD